MPNTAGSLDLTPTRKTGGESGQAGRCDRAGRQSRYRQHDAPTEREPNDGRRGRAKGGSYAELLLPLGHCMRHDAVESDSGEKQAQQAEPPITVAPTRTASIVRCLRGV